MLPDIPSPAVRGLTAAVHLVAAVLVTTVVVRAVTGTAELADDLVPFAGPTAVTAVAVAWACGYAVGVLVPAVTRATGRAAAWLAVSGVLWLVLLVLTADAVWLAFPLFFAQLSLLPTRWALPVVVLTTGAAIAGFGWHHHELTAATVLGPALGALVAVVTVLGYRALYRESERRRRLLVTLGRTRDELASAEHRAGMLAERERMAREIHDTVAQGLSSIQLLLRAAERALDDRPPPGPADPVADLVRQARETAATNLAEARRFVRDRRPAALDGTSLPEALRGLCARTTGESGPVVRCHVSGAAVPLSSATEAALWRVAQSALANTVAHARADRADVTLSYMDTEVALDVVDDGIGFDDDPTTDPTTGPGTADTRWDDGGFGLRAMRARVEELGGSLVVESATGRGTAVAATVPARTAGPAPATPGSEGETT
ncbi:sensor histidine kinase [Saccharomonospora iraqiensis]|uniref:sensor histidine kinase n=1 Tax=Saccharomonospora iraqiensis TaxID=52698 RepID=UPI0003108B3B|nr:sensor histidine kinase [Saccharomonospora iraqiensis]